jgi:hypothetical protein
MQSLLLPSTEATPRGRCQHDTSPSSNFISYIPFSRALPFIMASKLCCTVEQEGRPGSPDLPNARVSQATPANQPLLPKQMGSPSSHFTSARSEDLHELRQIFENAQDDAPNRALPVKAPRARGSRPSIYSLHSLHKMTSMRSILRRKFSKDLSKPGNKTLAHQHTEQNAGNKETDTIIKYKKEDLKEQLKITKDDLRKDLLSDKEPAEGGYDSDAQVLDEVARNIGKKTPSKRPSIHSVEWSPSTARFVPSRVLLDTLTCLANRHQTHLVSIAIASSSNAMCSLIRFKNLQYCLSPRALHKSSVHRTYAVMVRENAIARFGDLTRPPRWAFRNRLHYPLCDYPVSPAVIKTVFLGLMLWVKACVSRHSQYPRVMRV